MDLNEVLETHGDVAISAAAFLYGDTYEISKAIQSIRPPKPPTGKPLALKRIGNPTSPNLVGGAKAPVAPKPPMPPMPAQPKMPKASHIAKSAEVGVYCEISKVDTDKRQVFGWASISKKDGVLVRDHQGDRIETDDLEKAAYDFVLNSRKGGHEHKKTDTGPLHVSDMIESVIFTPEKKEAMGLPESFPEGWWIGMKVNDDEVWELAKSGELAGFSVHGSGRRVPLNG